jgi:outer membrane lipoprotein-sorting protein
MPFSMETGPKGGPKSQKMTIEKIEVNVPVDDAIFAFPATPAN